MRNRIAIIAGAITIGLMVTGIAWAAQDAESTVNVALAENQTITLPVEDAGVVVLSRANGQLQIVTATPNTGYVAEVEIASGREVEADFRGSGVRVQFNAELEDGVVQIRIRTEGSDGTVSTSTAAVTSTTGPTSSTGSTAVTSATSTTATAPNNASANLVLADGQVSQVQVADAGSVLLRRNGGSLTILSTESNPGWAIEVEVASGREVEGDFRNGGRRVKFNFELEDGVVRITIESEGSTGTSPTTTASTSTSTTAPTGTTNTTNGSSLPAGSVTYNLDAAGTVTVIFANGSMTIGSINPGAGWTVDKSEQSSDEIEVELRNGDSEATLRVRINNGQVEVEIENKSS